MTSQRSGGLVSWFRENLAFRPEDRRSALLVVVLHAIVGSALVVAFTARDAIFLSTTPDRLPLAYLVAAVFSGFAAGRSCSRWASSRGRRATSPRGEASSCSWTRSPPR